MATDLDHLVKAIEGTGILTPDELSSFIQSRGSASGDLLDELLKARKLSAFQAEKLRAGTPNDLVLGNYLLIAKLGEGGMGEVYQAIHRRMKRVVALKVIAPRLLLSPAAVQRFQREVEVAARLEHPNIVTAYDADEARGLRFLVMQYVDGCDLAAWVRRQGPLSPLLAVDAIVQAGRGLEHAHSQGVLHRDIKPANLLVDRRGTVKILDLGLAALQGDLAGQDDGLTATGMVMGTVDYMAPEQAESMKHLDGRADIYGLGMTFWYLLTGRAPYHGETTLQKVLAHRDQPLPSLLDARPDTPPDLEAVFRRMGAKQRGDRYETMTQVIADLEPIRSALFDKKRSGEALAPTEIWRVDSLAEDPPHPLSTAEVATASIADGECNTLQPLVPEANLTPASPLDSWRPAVLAVAAIAVCASLYWLRGLWLGDPPALAPVPNVAPNVAVSPVPAKNPSEPRPSDILASDDWEWTPPENMGPEINTVHRDGFAAISGDELVLIFLSKRDGLKWDLFESRRPSREVRFGPPKRIETIDDKAYSMFPCLSHDGNTLIYRYGTQDNADLWTASRKTRESAWEAPRSLGSELNSPQAEGASTLSFDQLTLIFERNRSDDAVALDLWESSRTSTSQAFGKPRSVASVDGNMNKGTPDLTSDSLALLYFRYEGDLWFAVRKTTAEPFSSPRSLGSPINSADHEMYPRLSADGRTLYFTSSRPGGYGWDDLWMSRRVKKQRAP